jgi:hypothetical protein
MKGITQTDISNFAGLVSKVWNDEKLHQRYLANPTAVLAEYGIKLPKGVPIPVIPQRPARDLREAGMEFKAATFENWEVTITHLPGGGPQGLTVSSLGCFACPVSCFSSLSN